jgi:aspartyl-tRNA(Asn)/glutamyl-tRNA(Gln) amidotransferase subunit A
VEDAAMVLQQIAGYDALDIDCLDYAVPDYSAALTVKVAAFRVGIPVGFFDHLDDETAALIEAAIGVLNKLTKGSHEVSLPSLLHAGVPGEVAAYHENVRGVNGGGYEPSTARAFPGGQDATRATDFIKGWRELELIRRTVSSEVFEKQGVDALAAPVVRHGIPTIEEELVTPAAGGGGGRGGRGGGGAGAATGGPGGAAAAAAPVAEQRARQGEADDNTKPFNGYGLPAISIPCGFTKDGMPVGLQLCGARFGEVNLLALAHAYEQATEWHTRRPPLNADTKVPALSKAASEQTGG